MADEVVDRNDFRGLNDPHPLFARSGIPFRGCKRTVAIRLVLARLGNPFRMGARNRLCNLVAAT